MITHLQSGIRIVYSSAKYIRMTSDGPLFHKPKSFLSARQTIYASILVGVLALLIRGLSVGIQNIGGIPVIAGTAVFYLVIIVLVKQMSHCHKWARTTVLLLYIAAMLVYPLLMNEQIKASMLVGALLLIQAALVIYALVLLYNKESTTWFNSLSVPEETV